MRTRSITAALCLFLLSIALAPFQKRDEDALVITDRMHHLGNDPTPDWPEAPEEPEGVELSFTFEARAGDTEGTLRVRQRHVNDPWNLFVNGQLIGPLVRGDALADHYYTVPKGVLHAGNNTLELKPEVPEDDITVGEILLWEKPLRDVLDLRRVTVRVRDRETQEPLPARVTFLRDEELAEVYSDANDSIAVRKGVVYTSEGQLSVELPAGDYRVYATRGMEWSMASADLTLGRRAEVQLELVHEVDTTGFIACDTHIHTLTFSGHGDSSVEERMVTLAGEGVELAVATDHNHNTDYRPTQMSMGLTQYFTPTVGNEISTPIGHFNAFPLDPGEDVPLHDSRDIEAIVRDARAKGAKAVILNHPRWPDHATGPFGVCGLDHHTGEPRSEPMTHPYDAMELINSQTEEKEPMLLFSDWFALMNAGERVRAVASSDSHTVGGVVGQGRTYIRSSTDDPAAIDVAEAADNIVQGRSSISMGIFVDVLQDGRSVMGELISANSLDQTGPLSARIAAPSWVQPRRMTVYVNGRVVQETELDPTEGAPFDHAVQLDYGGSGQDEWVVIVVTGDAVGGAWWPQINPYTLAASNPVRVDADGDLACDSPRATAERWLAELGTSPEAVSRILEEVDPPTAVHVLHGTRKAYLREAHLRALEVGTAAATHVPELEEYLEGLDEPR
jgi:hypothetical protein